MNSFARSLRQRADASVDFTRPIGEPSAASSRRALLAGASRAALALNPAAILARWTTAFARAARAFFLARLRNAARRRAVAQRAPAVTWRKAAFAALAAFGLAWTATPAAAGVAANYTPPQPPDCTDTTCSSSTGSVSLDTTGNGTGSTSVDGDSTGPGVLTVNTPYTTGSTVVGGTGTGTLNVISNTYTTGTLDVGQQIGGAGTVANWATMTDDAVIGDAGTGTYNNYGAHTVTGNLILGYQASGAGTYTIDGANAQTTVSFASPDNNGSAYPVNGTVTMTNPNANGALIVGNAGTGAFTQGSTSAGDTPTVSVAGDVVVGYQSGSAGTYLLDNGALTVGGDVVVGAASTGNNTFTQNGGSVQITGANSNTKGYVGVGGGRTADPGLVLGNLVIGGGAGDIGEGGAGTYTINGGTLAAQNIIEVGHSGTGTFNQNGGSVSAGWTLWIANDTGSAGTYNLASGTLTVGQSQAGGEQVGIFGTGTFNQTGGVNNSNGAVTLGNGNYNLSGGALNVVGSFNGGQNPLGDPNNYGYGANLGAIIGYGTGAFTQTGATTATFGTAATGGGSPVAGNEADVVIGLTDGSQGTYAIGASGQSSTPTADVYGSVIIGQGGDPTGLSNASTTIDLGAGPTNPNLVIAGDGTQFNVHYNGDGTAYSGPPNGGSNPQGVTNNAQSGNLIVGLNGNAAVTQTDGSTVNVDGAVVIGANSPGNLGYSGGSYTMTAVTNTTPTLNVGKNLDIGGVQAIPNGAVGYFQAPDTQGGIGYFVQSAGAVTVGSDVNIGNQGGTGVYDLSGGSLKVAGGINLCNLVIDTAAGYYGVGGGIGTVNQSGGAVTAGALTLGAAGSTVNPQGWYNLTGTGQLQVNGNEIVGGLGYGAFAQGDGSGTTSNTVTGALSIGDAVISHNDGQQYSRQGVYTLLDGTLTTGNTTVGNAGQGYFSQGGGGYSGGTHIVNGLLDIGAQWTTPACNGGGVSCDMTPGKDIWFGGPSYGEYDLSSGSVYALGGAGATSGTALIVGDAGTGVFNQTGGSVTTGSNGFLPSPLDKVAAGRGDLVIGAQSGGQGTYNLGSTNNPQSPTLQVYGDLTIGRDAGSNAGTTADSGSGATNPNLVIAGDGTHLSINQYTFGAGGIYTSANGGNLVVGLSGNGAVTQTDSSSVWLDNNLVLGANAGATDPMGRWIATDALAE